MRKDIVITFVSIGILVFGISVLLQSGKTSVESIPEKGSSPVVWETYENTTFDYSVRYPAGIQVGPYDRYDYTTPISEKSPISIGSVNITVWKGAAATGFSADENRHLTSLDLKSFAAAIRTLQVDNQITDLKQQVGGLQEITFASTTAYTFTLSGGFTYGEGGYLIQSGVTNRYIFMASPTNVKFMIWYPKDDPASEAIANSFRFTNSSTALSVGN